MSNPVSCGIVAEQHSDFKINPSRSTPVGAVFNRDLVRNASATPSRVQLAPTETTCTFNLWERFLTAIWSETPVQHHREYNSLPQHRNFCHFGTPKTNPMLVVLIEWQAGILSPHWHHKKIGEPERSFNMISLNIPAKNDVISFPIKWGYTPQRSS